MPVAWCIAQEQHSAVAFRVLSFLSGFVVNRLLYR